MSGKRSRNKGARGEAELCVVLRERGYEAKRTYYQQADRPDLTNAIPGFSIECKRTEHLPLWPALKQAQEAAGDDRPLLVFRRNRTPWFACLLLDDLLDLLEQLR